MSTIPDRFENFIIAFNGVKGDEIDLALEHDHFTAGLGAFRLTESADRPGDDSSRVVPVDGRSAPRRGLRETTEGNDARDGERLFKKLFVESAIESAPRTIADSYESLYNTIKKRGQKTLLRVKLRFNPFVTRQIDVMSLPWERLFDTLKFKKYLSLIPEDCTVVRCLKFDGEIDPIQVEDNLNVLVVAAEPGDMAPLELQTEIQNIKESVAGQSGIHIEFVGGEKNKSTVDALIDKLKQFNGVFHVLHYLGHGGYEEENGVLYFEDADGNSDPIQANTLKSIILKDYESIKLAFLNACDTALEENPFTGVAQALVKEGIPAVIAMQYPVLDNAAIVFAKNFYHAIGSYDPVDLAVAKARKAVWDTKQNASDAWEWATPVLFLQADNGRLFSKSTGNTEGVLDEGGAAVPENVTQPLETTAPSKKKLFLEFLPEDWKTGHIKPIYRYLQQQFDIVEKDESIKDDEAFDLSNDADIEQLIASRENEIEKCDAVVICWITGSKRWVVALKDYIHQLRQDLPVIVCVAGEETMDKMMYLDLEGVDENSNGSAVKGAGSDEVLDATWKKAIELLNNYSTSDPTP